MLKKITSKVPHHWIHTVASFHELLKDTNADVVMKEHLKKGFLGFGKADEMMFEESLTQASSQDSEIKTEIINWLLRCLDNPKTSYIPFSFRDMITNESDVEARAKVLIDYARMPSDEERNKRFKITNIKPDWITAFLETEAPPELTLLCDQLEAKRHERERQTGRSTIFGRLVDRIHARRSSKSKEDEYDNS